MMSNELTTTGPSPLDEFRGMNLDSPNDAVALLVRSGYFTDVSNMSQGAVKVMAGQALGLDPFTAMQSIDFVKGNLRLRSNLLATMVKRSDAYDYRVREWTEVLCRIEFFQGDDSIGFGEFTIEEAQRAGLIRDRSPWKTYPKQMLWARAMSTGVNAHCPDVTRGVRVYTEGDSFGPIRETLPEEITRTDDLNEALEVDATEAGGEDAALDEPPWKDA
ncbi:MAG: hypothetical protein GY820_39380 [Gammaproteobacteria bacterium]|nr:hypothetical protein [Gammaproteobacteria bacterium]